MISIAYCTILLSWRGAEKKNNSKLYFVSIFLLHTHFDRNMLCFYQDGGSLNFNKINYLHFLNDNGDFIKNAILLNSDDVLSDDENGMGQSLSGGSKALTLQRNL